jgi:hypothetical protein
LAAWLEQCIVSVDEFLFPRFNYYLDKSDTDIVILRRSDDSFVAAFSARGVTREGIIEAAKDDYGELVRAYRARQGQSTEGQWSHLSA